MDFTICGVPRHAWTGGDTPPRRFNHPKYRELRHAYFRDQIADCGGLDLWVCAGTSVLERARIFWVRARGDAWRTGRTANLF